MPDKKSPDDTTSSDTKKSGGIKRLAMIGALCVSLLAAGFVLGGRMGSPTAVADEGAAETTPTAETEDEEETVGTVIDLEPVNINLAENHYLRVAISVGLSPDVEIKEKEGKVFHTAPASDLLLETFSGRTIEELATAEGRSAAREELLAAVKDHYHGKVKAVFFTEFVTQ